MPQLPFRYLRAVGEAKCSLFVGATSILPPLRDHLPVLGRAPNRPAIQGHQERKEPNHHPADWHGAILAAYRARQNETRLFLGSQYKDGDLVFAPADGSPIPPWNFGAAFKDLVARSTDIPTITLHDLRDTHASLLAKAGVPLEVISKRLGHSNIVITAERYLGVYKERDAAAASAFDKMVS